MTGTVINDPPRILPCGEAALSVDFGNVISVEINAQVHALDAALRSSAPAGLLETVPTYRALTVYFDPLAVAYDDLAAHLLGLVTSLGQTSSAPSRRWRVPVAYGGAFGEDLDECAELIGLSSDAYVEAHSSALYRVMMIGFMPGFSYLSGLPDVMARPRRATPRIVVPAGSVSIGGAQAAIGSVEGPSGWHLLGRTPALPFLPGRDPLFLFRGGDEIRFEPISEPEYRKLSAQAQDGALVIQPGTAGEP